MSVRSVVKTTFLGKPGLRSRRIWVGLNRGLRFHIDTAHRSMRLIGLEEREIARSVRRLSSRAATGIDVGMNDGWYTLYLASLPNIREVHGFEPNDRALDAALANLRANPRAIEAKVTRHQAMVGDRTDPGWCRLDDVIAEPAAPVFIKIDVDGSELEVLHGAKRLLAGDCMVVTEVHSVELERDCLQFMKDCGYHCRIVDLAWYRAIFPERRLTAHHRWFVATR
jgi:Methyltransferase FkbM domain